MAKVRLGDYVRIRTGKLDANAADQNGKYPFFTCSIVPLCINTYSYDCECVLVAGNGDLNVKYYNGKFDAYQRTYIVESLDNKLLSVPYLYRFMDKYIETLRNISIGGVIKYIKLGNLTEASINLPTISKQNEIVDVLSVVDNLIKGVEQQLADLDILVKSRFVEMFGNPKDNPKRFKSIRIGELTDVLTGSTPNRSNKDYYEGKIPWVKTGEIHPGHINSTEECISEVALKETTCKLLPVDTVMIAMYGQGKTRGQSGILGIKAATNQACAAILPCEKLNPVFLNQYLVIEYSRLRDMGRGAQQANLNLSMIKNYHILSIPIELQNQFADFVAQVDKSKLAIQQSLDELETLKKSLMQQYFG